MRRRRVASADVARCCYRVCSSTASSGADLLDEVLQRICILFERLSSRSSSEITATLGDDPTAVAAVFAQAERPGLLEGVLLHRPATVIEVRQVVASTPSARPIVSSTVSTSR